MYEANAAQRTTHPSIRCPGKSVRSALFNPVADCRKQPLFLLHCPLFSTAIVCPIDSSRCFLTRFQREACFEIKSPLPTFMIGLMYSCNISQYTPLQIKFCIKFSTFFRIKIFYFFCIKKKQDIKNFVSIAYLFLVNCLKA